MSETVQAAYNRHLAEAERTMDSEGTPAEQRPARRRALMAAAERAEADAKAAASAAAEAAVERTRVARIIRLGSLRGCARQAARLALVAPLQSEAAAPLIRAFAPDAEATADVLAMPGPDAVGTFGSPAALAERRRVATILGCTGATFDAAVSIATTTDLPAEAARAALAIMPPVGGSASADRARADLERRSRAAGEFGPAETCATERRGAAGRSADLWRKAIADANASMGAPHDAGKAGETLRLDDESLDRLAAARGDLPAASPAATPSRGVR